MTPKLKLRDENNYFVKLNRVHKGPQHLIINVIEPPKLIGLSVLTIILMISQVATHLKWCNLAGYQVIRDKSW